MRSSGRPAASDYRTLVEFEDDPVVSSDIEGSSYSGVFDSLATMTLGARISKTLTWFDNGWGFVNRLADLLVRIQQESARQDVTLEVNS